MNEGYYDHSGYFTLRHRYPAVMQNLKQLVVTTVFNPMFDNRDEIVPVIKSRHMTKISQEIVHDFTRVYANNFDEYVTTEVFVCSPNDFWMAVQTVAEDLHRHKNSLDMKP